MKRSALLTSCICAYLTTMMDSSSEFQHLAFAPHVTVEGQFLASLAPPRDSVCACRAPSVKAAPDHRAATVAPGLDDSTGRQEAKMQEPEGVHERFWRVLVSNVPRNDPLDLGVGRSIHAPV
jgi:hypothetical protein